tara:strand:+ start:420 stop:578 length:159 start_codon:yes stop_codon:yes gene_type:complete
MGTGQARDFVTHIGASKMQHLEDVVAALEVELTTEDLARLEEVYQPHRVLGH